MKKLYLTLLTFFMLNSISSLIKAEVYLQNNYGAAIEYVETTPEMVRFQPNAYPPIKLGNGGRALVGRTSPFLSIRTVGGSYYDISYLFKEILVHRSNHPGDNALIVIYPRQGLSGIYSWNIKIEWETPGGVIPTFNKKMSK
jgi:hypothetical protein